MEPPSKPNESDCCNSGCNPCILDAYEALLRKYEKNVRKFNANGCELKNCISETAYTIFKLVDIKPMTPDTSLYSFEYFKNSDDKRVLALKFRPGQHFLLRGYGDGEQFTRAYTPIFKFNENPLRFSVVIKSYENGLMSKFITTLRLGSETSWRGPYGDYQITYTHKHILAIAQGTGIAPIFSVLREMLNNDECETIFKLMFCCHKGTDILLRNELREFGSFWNFTYEIFVTDLDGVELRYKESIVERRLGKGDLESYFGNKVEGEVQVLVCGSQGFGEAINGIIRACGVDGSNIFVF